MIDIPGFTWQIPASAGSCSLSAADCDASTHTQLDPLAVHTFVSASV